MTTPAKLALPFLSTAERLYSYLAATPPRPRTLDLVPFSAGIPATPSYAGHVSQHFGPLRLIGVMMFCVHVKLGDVRTHSFAFQVRLQVLGFLEASFRFPKTISERLAAVFISQCAAGDVLV